MRNPKDNLVSFYHWHKKMPHLSFPGTWSELFNLYQRKELYYGDMMEFNVGWWKHRRDDNFLFLFFEDMKRDPHSSVRRIAQHCHVTLMPEQVERIVAYSGFEAMRSSHAVVSAYAKYGIPINDYLRKGEVGDWRNFFTPKQCDYVDAQCTKIFDPVGLRFSCD